MRKIFIQLEPYRKNHPLLGDSPAGSDFGHFVIPRPAGLLRVISSGVDMENGWEHVSVSYEDRIPSWDDMQMVKQLFWDDEETVVQFHPRRSAYINRHPFTLHLWKRVGGEYSLPPKHLIG